MPEITVNGTRIDADPDDVLLKVCLDNGIDVPHYCWHRGLTPAGNCRMCLVGVSTSRKLEVACMTRCSEGLEVTTEGPAVDAGRKAVLEYMLINHPLDCPVCDKAGECDLQNFTFKYRDGHSRFQEPKVIRHTKDLGPNIRIWGNRCIACTRCVRFCDEITGTGELTLVNRGDHSVIDVHPEIPIDNPMSLNVVDICPVGALIDKNFLYEARVWYADRIDSVCASCSRGCNVTATVKENVIKRLQPRHNPEVNDFWMCDHGRLNVGYVSAPERLVRGRGTVEALAGKLQGAAGLAILVSTANTLEELHLVKRLAEVLEAPVGFYRRVEGERWVARNGFAIETDRTPNTRGATHLFGEADATAAILAGLADGSVRGLISINNIPGFTYPTEVVAAAPGLDVLAVSDIATHPLQEHATLLIPAGTWAERSGTVVNRDGRMQRIRPLVRSRQRVVADVQWLQELLVALGATDTLLSTEGVFRQLSGGTTYADLGDHGLELDR